MPKIDLSAVAPRTGSIYPAPYAAMMAGRSSLRLGDAGGLTQFGVNLVTLEPGAMSSLRHWHENEDEFVYVLTGRPILIDEAGEHPLEPGDAAAFPAGDPNGHHLVNRSDATATFLVVGTRAAEERGHYADVDLAYHRKDGENRFTRRDGSPVEEA